MKRCPECRRDYYDDSLLYCLDDGSALLEGPGSDRTPTAVLPIPGDEMPTRPFTDHAAETVPLGSSLSADDTASKASAIPIFSWRNGVIAVLAFAAVAAVYFYYFRAPKPAFEGSFRSVGTPAYDYYLRGKINAGSENRETNAEAIKILEDVVAADPTFAPAYAELGQAYGLKADFWAPDDQKAKLYGEAKLKVEKSLALDPNLAEGHFVRGALMWTSAGRFPHEQAVQSYKRAIELDPNLAQAHHQLGVLYYHIGLFDKGEDEIKKAINLNPSDSLARFRLGAIELYRTNYARSLTILKTVPPEVNRSIVDRAIANVLFALGRTDESAKIVDEFLAANSDEGGNVTSVKAMLLAKEGRKDEAEEAIRQAVEKGKSFQHFHHTTYNIASAYALLGNRDEALHWLQFTADEGFPCYPYFEKDTTLDSLRGDQRFIQMMANLKQQWERYSSEL